MVQDFPQRREFLKTAGGAALASALFPRNLRGANDRLNLAFIGCGRMGTANIDYAAKAGCVEIVGVCDIEQAALERAAAQARRLGFSSVGTRRDFREILADRSIDAVSIATPAGSQARIAIQACQAGKDVWCETPACVSITEGVQMVEAARQYRRVVQGGAIQRSGALFQKAREIVRSGGLGAIAFCNTFHGGSGGGGNDGGGGSDGGGSSDGDGGGGGGSDGGGSGGNDGGSGGAIAESGLHLLDLVQFTFDEAMPLSVSAQGGTPGALRATYRYPGFVAAYESRRPTSGTAFHGTRGTLLVNCGGYWIFPAQQGKRPIAETSREPAAMHVAHWKNFLECVRSRQRPINDIESCVRTAVTGLLTNLALRHRITLDWDEKTFTVKQQAFNWRFDFS